MIDVKLEENKAMRAAAEKKELLRDYLQDCPSSFKASIFHARKAIAKAKGEEEREVEGERD